MRRLTTGLLGALLVSGLALCLRGGFPAAWAAPDGGYSASQQSQVRRTGAQITAVGTVTRILADDRNGSRHQRFIIRLESGDTLLIAHNIDLAPRLAGLAVGERVRVSGEFAWNPRGGTLHWTHHDPQGRHVPGYIEWRGRRYQ